MKNTMTAHKGFTFTRFLQAGFAVVALVVIVVG
jgi:hypothetical protein